MNSIHTQNTVDLQSFHRIDINLYPLFVAIFEQKSISKAAQLLSISQSAASHALQRLRDLLQDDLFVRITGKMQPTPFSEQIYPAIKNALLAIQTVSVQQQVFDPSQIQSLKIAVHDEVEPMILPRLITHFQKIGLNIQILSIKLDRKNILTDLVTKQVDFVIDLEQHISDKLVFDSLIQDYFVACSLRAQMNQEIYLSSFHIGVSSRRTGLLVEDMYLQRLKLSRQIILRCQHYSTALQILQKYPDAILTIPQNILNHLQLSKHLNIFEVPVDLPILNIGMYWLKDMKLNKRLDFLRSEIYNIFA